MPAGTPAPARRVRRLRRGPGLVDGRPGALPRRPEPLRDYAHALGMQFGIWVEPERVNLVDGRRRRRRRKRGSRPHGGELRIGSRRPDLPGERGGAAVAARPPAALIDDVQPDYLKWDNNLWINCDRDGHGHGATDGNFAHVHGLYTMLDDAARSLSRPADRERVGRRQPADFGMLRYTDVAWMDDRTAPSVHVRHNIEGLSAVFPPAYLLSFVTDHEGEPLHDAPDLSLYFRSRMVATLGLCFRTADFTEGESASIAHEIAIYKTMRETLSVAAGALLTPQAQPDDGPAWDVLQESASGNQQTLISAFQTDQGVQKVNVKPTALDAQTMYVVQSVDTGVLGTASGTDLMANGVDLLQSPNTAAHILIIRARDQ